MSSGDEVMRLFAHSQALAEGSPERAAALRAPIEIASRAVATASPGEIARIASIASNACIQLSLEDARITRRLAWLRLAAWWARQALQPGAEEQHPFAAFHARMFLAQSLVRAGELARWRRARVAAEVIAIERAAPADRDAFVYAPLLAAAAATAIAWSIEARGEAGDLDRMIELLEAVPSDRFVENKPLEAAEMALRAAKARLAKRERSPADRAAILRSVERAFAIASAATAGPRTVLDELAQEAASTAVSAIDLDAALAGAAGAAERLSILQRDDAFTRAIVAALSARLESSFAVEPRGTWRRVEDLLERLDARSALRLAGAARDAAVRCAATPQDRAIAAFFVERLAARAARREK